MLLDPGARARARRAGRFHAKRGDPGCEAHGGSHARGRRDRHRRGRGPHAGQVDGRAMSRGYAFEVSSVVPAPPAVVWERITTFEGVNHELMPIVRMTCPPDLRRIDPATVPIGRPWFRSWIFLFGVLPFDYDHLRLVAIEPGRSFHEDSTMLTQR